MFRSSRILKSLSARQAPAFLPFEEAREWARSLGLGSQKEWETFHGRPPYIPSNPDRTYRDQYIGIHDWLGFVKTPRRGPRKASYSELCEAFRCPRRDLNIAGIEQLQNSTPNFEFLAMPRDARIPLLFRPRGRGSEDSWCGLRIRTSNKPLRNGRAVSFTYLDPREVAVLCIDLVKSQYFLLPQDSAAKRMSIFVTYGYDIHEHLRVMEHNLPSALASVFSAGPLRSRTDWLAAVADGGESLTCTNHSALSWLTSNLWNPANVSVEYPSSKFIKHNILLNGRRCLHRVGCSRQHKRSAQLVHISKRHDMEAYPFDASDGIDFVIVSPEAPQRGGTLHGCFVFPRDVLVENNIFSREGFGGVLQTGVYSPYGFVPKDKRVQRAVMWQHPYWIDLSGDVESVAQGHRKFCDILDGN